MADIKVPTLVHRTEIFATGFLSEYLSDQIVPQYLIMRCHYLLFVPVFVSEPLIKMNAKATKFVAQWSEALFHHWEKDRTSRSVAPNDLFWMDTTFLQSILDKAIKKLPAVPLQTFLITNIAQFVPVAAESLSTLFKQSAFTISEAPESENETLTLTSPSKLIVHLEALWTKKQLCRLQSDQKSIQDETRSINDMCSCTTALLRQWEQIAAHDCERIRNIHLKLWTTLLLFPSIKSSDPFDASSKIDPVESSASITRAAVCLIAVNSASQNDAFINKAIQLVVYYNTLSYTESNLTKNWLMDVLLEMHRSKIYCAHETLTQLCEAAFSQKAPESKHEMIFLNTISCYRFCTGAIKYAPRMSEFGVSLGKQLLPIGFCQWANSSANPKCKMLAKFAHKPAASIMQETVISASMFDTFVRVRIFRGFRLLTHYILVGV